MTFSTAKELQASYKFLLLRMKPARHINSLLTYIGSNRYTATIDVPSIASIYENGTLLTRVYTTPSIGEYYYNESTKLLTIYPTDYSNNALIMYFYLFYTTEINRVVYEDPMNTSTTQRDWLPRIKTSPSVNQSVKNIFAGQLSISASDVTIINDNEEFQSYITDNDSFYQKDVEIWTCIDSISNIDKTFKGLITEVSLANDQVTFNFNDSFSKLRNKALMGDLISECYFSLDDNANLEPRKNGFPIRYIFGPVSKYSLRNKTVTNLSTAKELDNEGMLEAACTNYNQTISTSNNREWGICRVSSDGFADFTCTPSVIDNGDANFSKFTITAGEIAKFYIGDSFKYGSTYGRVLYADKVSNYLYTTPVTGTGGVTQIEGNNCPSIVISVSNNNYYPLYSRDYTATVSTTSGNNKYLKIIFTNNFEATLSMATLDPTLHQVFFRVHPSIINGKHASVLKKIINTSGIETDTTSFTNANTDLDTYVAFSIPSFDETDYNNYIDYVQKILYSTFGYLSLDSDLKLNYYLFKTPTSTTEITDTDILKNSFRIDINYNDIITQLIAYNQNIPSEDFPDSSKTISDKKSLYLHGIDNSDKFVHILTDLKTRLDDIYSIKSNRNILYRFKTKTKNLDSKLGNDFLIKRDGLINNIASKSLKIIELNKKTNSVDVTLTDLYDL